jgi:hypothetical protein
MHTLIKSAGLLTLNRTEEFSSNKVHVEDIQNISLSVDHYIDYVNRGFPRFL